jgi:hypothetical protein
MNRGASRVNATGAGFVVILFVVVFHGRDCRSRRAVVNVVIAAAEIAVDTVIAFAVIFEVVVVAVIAAVVVVIVTVMSWGQLSEK